MISVFERASRIASAVSGFRVLYPRYQARDVALALGEIPSKVTYIVAAWHARNRARLHHEARIAKPHGVVKVRKHEVAARENVERKWPFPSFQRGAALRYVG